MTETDPCLDEELESELASDDVENDRSVGWFSWLLILMVRGYQVTLSPFLGGYCRFEPSCSRYFIQAVEKHGAIRGAAKGIYRVLRCQPFCKGGYDPP